MAAVSRDRAVLGFVGVAGLASESAHVAGMPGAPSAAVLLVLLASLAAVAVFVARGTLAAGAFVLAALTVGARVELAVRPSPMPGLEAVLAGVLWTAWLGARAVGRSEDDAREAACGALAAALVLAAASKIAVSGAGWVDGRAHARWILERGIGVGGALGAVRAAFASSTALCSASAVAALAVEAAGVAWLWPAWRRPHAVLLTVLFAGLAVLYGIVQPSWVVAAWGLSRPAPSRYPERDTTGASSPSPYRSK